MGSVMPAWWIGSRFEQLRALPLSERRVAGRQFAVGWLAARGFNVTRCGDSDADRIVEGKRVVVRFSALSERGGYRFRPFTDQNYELAVLCGVSPCDAHCWVIPKADVLRLWKVDHEISSQHGGAKGSDTAWIDVPLRNPPVWLNAYGGTLSDGILVLSKLTGFKVKKVREELAEYDVAEGGESSSAPSESSC